MTSPSRAQPQRPILRRLLRSASGLACALTAALPAFAAGPRADVIAADTATAARLEALAHVRAHARSVQADVVTVTYGPRRRFVGRIVLAGASAYYRATEESAGGDKPLQESAVNAQEQITINHESLVATRVDIARLRAVMPNIVIPNSARDLVDIFSKSSPGAVHYLGPVRVDGATLDRFRVAAGVGPGPAGELLVWMDPADGFPRRVELRSPSGRRLLKREFVNVKLNAPIPPEVFTLEVPAGIPVQDLTDAYLTRERGDGDADS